MKRKNCAVSLILVLSFFICSLLIAPQGSVSAAGVEINADNVSLYGLDSWATEYISIPSELPQSFKLEVTGAENVDFWVSEGKSVTVTSSGLIEPVVKTIYWVGNIGYYEPTGKENEVVTREYTFGKSKVTVTADGVEHVVDVEVIDYAEAYTDSVIDKFIAENITDSMSQYEKIEKACEFTAGYDYSVKYQSTAKMIITGEGGDCWASANTIVRICRKLGMNAWIRNGNKDPGSGSGHRNAMIEGDGVYYIGEAGYSGSAPRPYSVYTQNSLFSYKTNSAGGISVYQYEGQDSPERLVIPETIDGKTVTAIAPYFYSGSGLSEVTELVIPDTVTSIGEEAFYNCSKLTEIDLPDSVRSIGDGAFGYTSISEITIPASVTEISGDPFVACSKMTDIYVEDGNTAYESVDGVLFTEDRLTLIKFPCGRQGVYTVPDGTQNIGGYAFGFADKLSAVYMPESVENLGDYCFYRSAIAMCEIPSSVTSLPFAAFYGCTELQTLNFGSSVTEIGKYALYNCSALKTIYFNGTPDEYSSISIDANNNVLSGVTVIYPGTEGNAYSITYNINDGSGAKIEDVYYSAIPAYRVISPKMEGESIKLTSWNTEADGSGTEYAFDYEFAPTENMVLYGQWTVKTYKISFLRNESSYTLQEILPSQYKNHDEVFTIPADIPVLSGLNFISWNTSSDGTGETYHPGDTYAENKNLTLYAQWEKLCLQVTFDANGGEGAPAPIKRMYGSEYSIPAKIPTREGYEFRYWMTSPNGGYIYYPSRTYTMKSNLTLYASWKTASTYTITYDANGGTASYSTQTKTHGTAITLYDNPPTLEGYSFVCWNTERDGSGISYNPGDEYTAEGNVTLYAQWKKDYVITYDANGGEGAPGVQYKKEGADITITAEQPTLDGYAFVCWNTEKDGSGASYSGGSRYSEDSDATLYAQWVKVYMITYDANGGVGTYETYTKTEGVDITLTAERPTREGYTFVCWNTAKDGSGDSYDYYDVYTKDSDATLYAQWEVTTYNVYFGANYTGGFNNNTIPETQKKIYNEPLTIDESYPTRFGYVFVEWNTAKDGSGTSYMPGDTYNENASVQLYAQWKINEYTIEFFANGGEGAPDTIVCGHAVSITIPDTIPVREGYKFLYWVSSDSPDGGGVMYYPGSTLVPYKSHTLYAHWEPVTYIVSYDANGGENPPASQEKKYDSELELSSALPSREGYTFTGWNTDADGSGVSYEPGDVYTANESVTLYAQWSANSSEVIEAPSNLYAYTFGYTSIRMTWNAVDGAEGYEIFRCDRAGQPYNYVDTVSADAGETAYRNIGLSTGTTYYYKVRAYKTLDNGMKLYSDFSAYSSARPLPATPVVTAVRTSSTTADISWVKIYGATGYSVYRSTEENGTYTFAANFKSGDITTYKATGLDASTTYYYKVRAYRQMGDDMMFGSYSKPAAAVGAPAAPVITARSVGYTSAKILWESVAGADGYAIYRCDVGGGTYSYITSVGADVTTYTNTGLSTGTTYYYKVRAFVNTDSGKLYSNYSACATARPLPATPVVTVTADAANNTTISWVRIYGATGYSVYRSTEKDGTYSFLAGISSGDTVSYTDKNTDEGVTYYYKVRAYRQMGKDMMFGEYSKPAYVK